MYSYKTSKLASLTDRVEWPTLVSPCFRLILTGGRIRRSRRRGVSPWVPSFPHFDSLLCFRRFFDSLNYMFFCDAYAQLTRLGSATTDKDWWLIVAGGLLPTRSPRNQTAYIYLQYSPTAVVNEETRWPLRRMGHDDQSISRAINRQRIIGCQSTNAQTDRRTYTHAETNGRLQIRH